MPVLENAGTFPNAVSGFLEGLGQGQGLRIRRQEAKRRASQEQRLQQQADLGLQRFQQLMDQQQADREGNQLMAQVATGQFPSTQDGMSDELMEAVNALAPSMSPAAFRMMLDRLDASAQEQDFAEYRGASAKGMRDEFAVSGLVGREPEAEALMERIQEAPDRAAVDRLLKEFDGLKDEAADLEQRALDRQLGTNYLLQRMSPYQDNPDDKRLTALKDLLPLVKAGRLTTAQLTAEVRRIETGEVDLRTAMQRHEQILSDSFYEVFKAFSASERMVYDPDSGGRVVNPQIEQMAEERATSQGFDVHTYNAMRLLAGQGIGTAPIESEGIGTLPQAPELGAPRFQYDIPALLQQLIDSDEDIEEALRSRGIDPNSPEVLEAIDSLKEG